MDFLCGTLQSLLSMRLLELQVWSLSSSSRTSGFSYGEEMPCGRVMTSNQEIFISMVILRYNLFINKAEKVSLNILVFPYKRDSPHSFE
jgi:hypothetical protein